MTMWYYSGKTPSPIDHPTLGAIVITPRTVFEAPASSVQTLVDAGLVTKANPAMIRREELLEKKRSAQSKKKKVVDVVSAPSGSEFSNEVKVVIATPSLASTVDVVSDDEKNVGEGNTGSDISVVASEDESAVSDDDEDKRKKSRRGK